MKSSAFYTRAIAASFLRLHAAALKRVARAAEAAADRKFRDSDNAFAQVAAAQRAVNEMRSHAESVRHDALIAEARAEATQDAVEFELEMLPFIDHEKS